MTDEILTRDYPLSRPCEKCGAEVQKRCGPECHSPQPIGPELIRIDPGDAYDPNPDMHPEPARHERQWRRAL